MWITKLKIKHDCVIGSRCERFSVTTIGTPFDVFIENGITHAPQIQTLHGMQENIEAFVKDFKKEKRIKEFTREGNTIFFIEIRKEKIPASFYHPKLIHVKPVFVDKEGFEYWEVASWKKKILTDFITKLIKDVKNIQILKIEKTKLTDIYFSRLMPKLTSSQKRAIELAYEHGYYKWPKQTDFGKLSKIMNVSISTYREHLKKAEEKLMPDIIRLVE